MNKPNLTCTMHTLPFDRLDALTFERLCLWLVRANGYERPEHYGLAGTEQGRDIVAYLKREQREELWYFQCKRYRRIDGRTLKDDVDKIRKLSFGIQPLRPTGLVFLVAGSVSANLRDDVKQYSLRSGLICEFWAHTELDMYVKEHPHIVHEFFGLGDRERYFIRPATDFNVPAVETLIGANQLLESIPTDIIPSPSPLPACSRMVYGHNPLFVGREDVLSSMAKCFALGSLGQIVAITGLGGIGKTQIASEFAHRYGHYFAGGVFWLNCQNPENIAAEVAACGGPQYLRIDPDFDRFPLDTQVDLVLAAWNSPLPRLLILDSCEDETVLLKWRRISGGTRSVVTSRRAEWSASLGTDVFRLDNLNRRDSIELIRKYSPDPYDEEKALNSIAQELGDHPLALHLAGSFLARYRNSFPPPIYFSQLSCFNLLDHPSLEGLAQEQATSPTLHDPHLTRTLAVSYERLDSTDPVDALAIKILARAAYLAPDIPLERDVLFMALNDLQNDDTEGLLRAEDATHRLVEIGLLQKHTEKTLRLHPLIALFAQVTIIDTDARKDVELGMISSMTFWNYVGYSRRVTTIEPHLRVVTDAAIARQDENSGELAYELGYHFYHTGDYLSSQNYLEKALILFEQLKGEMSIETGKAANALGILLRTRGHAEQAKALYERSLKILEHGDKDNRSEMAQLLSNLGMVLTEQCKYSEAIDYFERAQGFADADSEIDDIMVSAILNNKGLALHEQGRLDEALVCYEQALDKRRSVFGEHHQRTAEAISNIGGIHFVQSDNSKAKQFYSTALHIYELVLDEHHPDIARTLNFLAQLCERESELSTAQTHYERALEIYRTSRGEDDPYTLKTTAMLATLLVRQEDFGTANPLIAQLLLLVPDRLGSGGESIAQALTVLGELLIRQGGNADRARSLLSKALDIFENIETTSPLAEAMPCVLLATLNKTEGRYEEAAGLSTRALELVETVVGSDSIITADHLHRVADIFRLQAKYSDARAYYERAIEIYDAVDPLNLDYASILNNCGVMRRYEGSYALAIEFHERALTVLETKSMEKSPAVVQGLNNLAVAHRALGNYKKARKLLDRALALTKEIETPEGELLALCIHNLASLTYYEGDHEMAEILIKQAISIYEKSLGAENPSTQLARESLIQIVMEQMRSSGSFR